MKRRKDESLPDDLTKALLWFAEVMYYRFEFSRGGYWYQEIAIANPFKELFPSVFERESFLLPDAPTYLDVLKKDIRKAGKQSQEAKDLLRMFVESSLCPLFNFETSAAFLGNRNVESFFPDPEVVELQLRNYCFQLLELQEYLIEEIGVKPGSLLPVWITGETTELGSVPEIWAEALTDPDGEPNLLWGNVVRIAKLPAKIDRAPGSLPLLGTIPVDPYIVETITAYIVWEYGHNHFRIRRPPRRKERNKTFYALALRWGRIMYYRWLQGIGGDGNVGFNIKDWANLGRAGREKERELISDEEDWLKDLPVSLADEIYHELMKENALVDKYIRPLAGKPIKWNSTKTASRDRSKATYDKVDASLFADPKRREDRCRELSNDAGFRKNVDRAMLIGFYLFYGYCRHFWRL